MYLDARKGAKVPQLVTGQVLDFDATLNEHVLGLGENALQGSLNTIVNIVQNTGTHLQGQGQTALEHRVTDGQTRGILVHLVLQMRKDLFGPPQFDEFWLSSDCSCI